MQIFTIWPSSLRIEKSTNTTSKILLDNFLGMFWYKFINMDEMQ